MPYTVNPFTGEMEVKSISGGGSGSVTITGDTGSITGQDLIIQAGQLNANSGKTVGFTNSGTTSRLNLSDSGSNTFLGSASGQNSNPGSLNTAIGSGSLMSTTGYNNVAVGAYAGYQILDGSANVLIGQNAGFNYAGNEILNVIIGNNILGIAGESNVIRIGRTSATANYQGGIAGITLSGSPDAVVIDAATGQLGSKPFPSGGLTSVTGTANRITSTAGTTPVIDISPNYVGQGSITTLGTIATGTWNATAISAVKGGTGQTAYTVGDLLYSSATNTVSKLGIGSANQVLTVVSGVPAWSTTSTAPLPYTNVNGGVSTYTVLTTDYYISVDTSAGAVTLRFPNAPTSNRSWVIKDRTGNASTNNINVTTPSGAVFIDGQITYKILSNFGSVSVIFNGLTYEIY